MLEVGRVCMKTAGREAGRYCVILKRIDDNFLLVTGPKSLTKIKRRKCNQSHLQPLGFKLEIKEDASEEEVLEAWKKSGLLEKLGLKLPAFPLKEKKEIKEEKKVVKKEEKKKETKGKKKKK